MKKTRRGYIIIYKPKHPFHQRGGWVFEHRLVIEKYLGRFLTKEEVVHHIDGNKENNFIGNLMLFANHGEHVRYHLDNGWRERISREQKGRRHRLESIEKMKKKLMGNRRCLGRIMSEETRRKISEGVRRHYEATY